jgi:hypothetical protein
MAEAIETALLKYIHDNGDCKDSGDFAKELGVDHLAVVGVIKSLQASEMILIEVCRPILAVNWLDLAPDAPAAAEADEHTGCVVACICRIRITSSGC